MPEAGFIQYFVKRLETTNVMPRLYMLQRMLAKYAVELFAYTELCGNPKSSSESALLLFFSTFTLKIFPRLPSRVLYRVLQWHALSREEQAKYYELARKERQLHMQLYPGWSARDNYVSF